METETIDLTIGGIDFDQCIVDFEYDSADNGSSVQPPYAEDLRIIRVQFFLNDELGFSPAIWVDLQDDDYHSVAPQVLDWIHTKQADSELDKAETYTERRMREMENEAWEPRR